MKQQKTHIIILLLSCIVSFAQTTITEGLYNHTDGVIQMHNNAQLGIHTHLINDGTFNENEGFTGFYNIENDGLTVNGTERAVFNNVEVAVFDDLNLFQSLGVKGDFEFTLGDVVTPRDQIDISLDFLNHRSIEFIDLDDTHVDGYTSHRGQEPFIFPVGDDGKYRPMILPTQPAITTQFNGAYFFDNPEDIFNNDSDFPIIFDRNEKIYFISNISDKEFWDLNGSTETQVTLTWDNQSDIPLITENLEELIVTGWNITNSRWESLGNVAFTGNMNEGQITSIGFVPDEYDIITFAGIRNQSNNFYLSPTSTPGENDSLFFDELTEYDRGILKIFNRWGNIVYESDDYEQSLDGEIRNGDFSGISNGRATIQKNKRLPTGTYFYELEYGNENFENLLEGWIYILND